MPAFDCDMADFQHAYSRMTTYVTSGVDVSDSSIHSMFHMASRRVVRRVDSVTTG